MGVEEIGLDKISKGSKLTDKQKEHIESKYSYRTHEAREEYPY